MVGFDRIIDMDKGVNRGTLEWGERGDGRKGPPFLTVQTPPVGR